MAFAKLSEGGSSSSLGGCYQLLLAPGSNDLQSERVEGPDVDLAGCMGERSGVITVRKLRPTPEQFPRRVGVPGKRPL